jgi:hypothetical protein
MPAKRNFSDGAIVTNAKTHVDLITPEDARNMALAAGIDEKFVPDYAGDRMSVFRCFRKMIHHVKRDNWLLTQIKSTKTEVVYGISKVTKDEVKERVDHDFEATIAWRNDNPDHMEGDHEVAKVVDNYYQELRGKLHGDDWTTSVRKFLQNEAKALSLRGDEGIVYWCPPDRLSDLNKIADFLVEYLRFGMLILRIESRDRTVCENVASTKLNDQIEKLKAEVEKFDGKQRSTVYSRRLEQYQELRKTATMYKGALGIATSDLDQVLAGLEAKVKGMFDLRGTIKVQKDGTVIERTSNGLKKFDLSDETYSCYFCDKEGTFKPTMFKIGTNLHAACPDCKDLATVSKQSKSKKANSKKKAPAKKKATKKAPAKKKAARKAKRSR